MGALKLDDSADERKGGDDLELPEPEVLPPHELLRQFEVVNIAAPMVRFSKLPFRQLVSEYDTHITHTPMILAKEFMRSSQARDADFTTSIYERGSFWMPPCKLPRVHPEDEPDPERTDSIRRKCRRIRGSLIAQFAANEAVHLASATELIRPWVDAIDINCGCPQQWAYSEGIGSFLLRQPETVRDLVRTVKDRVGYDFPVNVKIRVDSDLSKTAQLIRTAISAGASMITVHGRTRHQASSSFPVDLEAVKFAVESAKGDVPVVANGDIWNLDDARRVRNKCGVRGIMSARGLLGNPALFSGYDQTPASAIHSFIKHSVDYGLIFSLFHRHVSYMLESHFTRRSERIYFNSLASHASVLDYVDEHLPSMIPSDDALLKYPV